MRLLQKTEKECLDSKLTNDSNYENRVRAHVLLLYEKYFSISSISNAYDIGSEHTEYVLQFFIFFGIEEYFDTPYEKLKTKVDDERFRIEKEKLNRKKKINWFGWVLLPISYIYKFLSSLPNMLEYVLALITSSFIRLKKVTAKKRNYVNIEKGASHNYIVQINELKIDGSNEKTEKLIFEQKEQVVEKVKKLIISGKEFDFQNTKANKLFSKAQETNQNPKISDEQKNNEIHLYAIFIVALLIYSTTFKGGISSITIFGISIVVGIRACMPIGDVKNTLTTTDKEEEHLSIVDSVIQPKLNNDTLEVLSKSKDSPIVDIQEYKSLVPNWFEPDLKCTLLSAFGKKQRNFIQKLDYVDHESQDYYIWETDDKYYIHVVAYSNIKEAAFQMHHINEKTTFEALILETITKKGFLYSVVIGKFNGNEAREMAKLIDEWDDYCFSNNVEIGCYYNG